MKPPNNEAFEDANPFAVFTSASAIMAYVHKRLGREVRKRVLAEIPEADSEWLSAQADQLKALGLKDVAAIQSQRSRAIKRLLIQDYSLLPTRSMKGAH